MLDSGIAARDIRQAWGKAEPSVLLNDKAKIKPVTFRPRKEIVGKVNGRKLRREPPTYSSREEKFAREGAADEKVQALELQQLPTPAPSVESSPEPVPKRVRSSTYPVKAPSTAPATPPSTTSSATSAISDSLFLANPVGRIKKAMLDSGIAARDIHQASGKAKPSVLPNDKAKIKPVTSRPRKEIVGKVNERKLRREPPTSSRREEESAQEGAADEKVQALELQQLPTPAPSVESSPEPVPKRARSSMCPAQAPSTTSATPPSTTSSATPAISDPLFLAKPAAAKKYELATLRLAYEAARRDGGAAFIALDVEFWERDHSVLLEFGWSVVEFVKEEGSKKVKERRQDQHVVIKENRGRRNGRYSPDARDHFDFGRTLTLPSESLYYLLHALFSTLSSTSPAYLIFHDPRGDLRALANLGFDVERDFERELKRMENASRNNEDGGVWIVDTQRLFGAWLERKSQVGLEKACAEFEVPTKRLHNAGNDAHYTLDLFERLMDRSRVPSPNSKLIKLLDERARIAEEKKQKGMSQPEKKEAERNKVKQERMEQEAVGKKLRQGEE
ncbi:SPOSA6832_04149 [Sporobolomyces salmonicolor]|uniref:SPOSA6832_04149-mRNA-1:cds n=1 Tax=Sporidiobolus salmonicolor TaxID=5005 RepID=A0A0D6ES00_SPOSA|nr:SPOSA6832_04149 [Sporobolomyces salmonicolor]